MTLIIFKLWKRRMFACEPIKAFFLTSVTIYFFLTLIGKTLMLTWECKNWSTHSYIMFYLMIRMIIYAVAFDMTWKRKPECPDGKLLHSTGRTVICFYSYFQVKFGHLTSRNSVVLYFSVSRLMNHTSKNALKIFIS